MHGGCRLALEVTCTGGPSPISGRAALFCDAAVIYHSISMVGMRYLALHGRDLEDYSE